MHRSSGVAMFALTLSLLALAGCNAQETAGPAQPMQANAIATTTVGGVTLQASTLDVADLNDAVARRYAIDRSGRGMLLVVTVRDAEGDGIEVGDLQLDATCGALPEVPKPLELRAITTDGMTDYIGVFNTSPPATVQFGISAVRDGSRAEIRTTAELYPR